MANSIAMPRDGVQDSSRDWQVQERVTVRILGCQTQEPLRLV